MKHAMFISLSLALLALAGCNRAGTENAGAAGNDGDITADDLRAANVTLEFWHAQSSDNGDALNRVVELFNTTNEYGITVNATYQGGYGDTNTKIMSALAAGTPPNVGQAYNNNMLNYMPSGRLMDLTDYLTDGFGITQEELADVYPSYLAENSAFPDGRTYAVSLAKSTEIFFYNKTFFDEHNIQVPETYDELYDVAEQITAITGKPAIGFDSTDNLGIYGPVNFGARYADTQGNLYIYDDDNLPITRSFYEWWQRGIREGIFRTAGEDQYCGYPFVNQDIMAFTDSSSAATYLINDDFEVAAARVPVGPNPAVVQQGGNFCGFTIGDPVTDLATSIFLEFMYSGEASGLYAAGTGYVPSSKRGLESEAYKECIAAGGLAAETKEMCTSYPEDIMTFDPVFRNSYQIRGALEDVILSLALDRNADIDTLIQQTESNIDSLR